MLKEKKTTIYTNHSS